jgi:hypothetical protein
MPMMVVVDLFVRLMPVGIKSAEDECDLKPQPTLSYVCSGLLLVGIAEVIGPNSLAFDNEKRYDDHSSSIM